ncbi:glutaredoxin family protein [Inmirania thermothiophila]|uniref:Glutaredoxin n=1 Tax=Inmirania thermothiophila TaxID=1750597 RepID=A0A3N1Y4C3_9GAMM|nr:glutaredoxin family protein [Inmirania thermothiophila]ROR32127.1 glutaredoxin [Inmirania thermothiophila]
MSERRLTLYGHGWCHLCEAMEAALAPWQARLGFALEVVDIEGEPGLEARYGERVPVLTEGETEICFGRLDEAALLRHLGHEAAS